MAESDSHQTSKQPDFLSSMVEKLSSVLSFAFPVAMAVLIFEVLLRYLFNSPTIWGHETSIFLCALSFIWGGLYCVPELDSINQLSDWLEHHQLEALEPPQPQPAAETRHWGRWPQNRSYK